MVHIYLSNSQVVYILVNVDGYQQDGHETYDIRIFVVVIGIGVGVGVQYDCMNEW